MDATKRRMLAGASLAARASTQATERRGSIGRVWWASWRHQTVNLTTSLCQARSVLAANAPRACSAQVPRLSQNSACIPAAETLDRLIILSMVNIITFSPATNSGRQPGSNRA
jgi:hypothetical protein